MAEINKTLLLTALFGVIGVLLLIASSLYLDAVMGWAKACTQCAEPNFMIAASALGIIAGLGQVAFCIVEFVKPDLGAVRRYWLVVNIVVFVLSLIAFSMSMHYTRKSRKSYIQYFNVVTCMDWIFCVLAVIVDKYVFKNNH